MGFVESIQKQKAKQETVEFVKNKVIPLLAELFGLPNWLNPEKTKVDQKPEEIIRQWAIALEPYREEAVTDACYRLFKYKNVSTFPTLSQLLSQLGRDDLKESEHKKEECSYGISLESQYMAANKNSNLYNHCLLNDYTRAIKYIINEFLPEKIGQSEYARVKRRGYSELVNLAQRNGLFNDFNSILIQVYKRYHGIAEQEVLPL